jgi:PAS domain S-box-containing protein
MIGWRSDSLSARLLCASLLLLVIVPAVGFTLGAGIRAYRAAVDDAQDDALSLARSEDPTNGLYIPVAYASRAAVATDGLLFFNLVSVGIAALLALAVAWWKADQLLRQPDDDASVRYRDLFENANDTVYAMDMQGNLTAINRTGEMLLGYTRDELLGKSSLRLAAPEDHAAANERLAAKVAGGGPTVYESTLIAKDGRRIPIEVSTKALHRDGKPSEILAVARDITERKRADERLRREMAERVRLEAEIIQSAKIASLGIMAGGIAHEVRNPLAIVSAAAQLLLEQPDDEGLRAEGLQRIQTGVQRATSIVENLLKFAGPMPGGMEAADINDIVRDTLTLVDHEVTQRGINLQTHLAKDVRPVRANAGALEQVFTNLILNACQAVERDGTIMVSTGMQGSDVTVSVRDTGPGIGPQDLRRLFDPFFTTRPPGEGTGLGLAISYRIVEQHRGTIDAFNNEEGGAMFVVRLPGVDAARRGAARLAAPVSDGPVV